MYRLVLAVVGLVQLAAPDWVVYAYTRLAYEQPAAFRVRRWVPLAIRLEGLVMLWTAIRGEGRGDGADRSPRSRVSEAPEPP